jgi:hypothetical protein
MQTAASLAAPSPFDLENDRAYQAWRARKLAQRAQGEPIKLGHPGRLSDIERRRILVECAARNFAIFRVATRVGEPQTALQAFGRRLGLLDLDQNLCAEETGVTAITVKRTATDKPYIPYSNRPLGWHTDGYYNAGGRQVRAWLLYCAQPAAEGGDNELLDHEIAYIRLRDHNPDWIRALMAPNAMTIPSNEEGGRGIRPDHAGPVFSVSPHDGTLHMRYSARPRNVIWAQDDATRSAAAFLLELFRHGDEHGLRYRLSAGEGVISNNVLHRRDGFRDDPATGHKRLLYRARYYQRLPLPEVTKRCST